MSTISNESKYESTLSKTVVASLLTETMETGRKIPLVIRSPECPILKKDFPPTNTFKDINGELARSLLVDGRTPFSVENGDRKAVFDSAQDHAKAKQILSGKLGIDQDSIFMASLFQGIEIFTIANYSYIQLEENLAVQSEKLMITMRQDNNNGTFNLTWEKEKSILVGTFTVGMNFVYFGNEKLPDDIELTVKIKVQSDGSNQPILSRKTSAICNFSNNDEVLEKMKSVEIFRGLRNEDIINLISGFIREAIQSKSVIENKFKPQTEPFKSTVALPLHEQLERKSKPLPEGKGFKPILVEMAQIEEDKQLDLGLRLIKGDRIKKNLEEGIKLIKYAAGLGNADAQFNLGYCFQTGRFGVKKDLKKAVKYYQLAAIQGHAGAQTSLGICYKNGNGVNASAEEAIKLFKFAAAKGNTIAQANLEFLGQILPSPADSKPGSSLSGFSSSSFYGSSFGGMYSGTSVLEKHIIISDYQKLSVLNAHGRTHILEARYNLGLCCANGIGIEKNSKAAFEHYQNAGGFPPAVNNLALCYATGTGTEKNIGKAFETFKYAASAGLADAQNNLGVCYAKGIGTEPNILKAIELFQLAADQGNAAAQASLKFLKRDPADSKKGSSVSQPNSLTFFSTSSSNSSSSSNHSSSSSSNSHSSSSSSSLSSPSSWNP